MAESDAEFDKLFEGFLTYREEHSYTEIVKYQQERVNINKEKKLGIK